MTDPASHPQNPPAAFGAGAPTIFISAGEESGDLHGAALARALRERYPAARLIGLGGARMRAQGVQTLAGLDELLSSILQASLARTTLADNEDMRKISAYAGIIAVPTAIAGIYGMNFEHMPELHWRYGYPLVLAVVLLACVLLYRGFKRNGWL